MTKEIILSLPVSQLLLNGHSSNGSNGIERESNIIPIDLQIPEILCITSFPPRECGIATYSQDLINAFNQKFGQSYKMSICALEANEEHHQYESKPKYLLDVTIDNSFIKLAFQINKDENIRMVLMQHEFGFFAQHEAAFFHFIHLINKPIVFVFHTVLPHPDENLKILVQEMAAAAPDIIIMTHNAAEILINDYKIDAQKIKVIPHGTHLVQHSNKYTLKTKYGLTDKIILSTFGLLSLGKNIETTLRALPTIIVEFPNVLFLVLGKTHPNVVAKDGEKYRDKLEALVANLGIENYVQFVNKYLPVNELLDYLQLTDIYLFTSNDPYQAVSGTFAYAISSGCPVISTPIPHAKEVLKDDAGILIDFEKPTQLSDAVIQLLENEEHRNQISSNGLHKMAQTAWENAAIAHALLFEEIIGNKNELTYQSPPISLAHLKKMTTDFGIIQFSKINHPDLSSGYTLDDNARALIVMCQHFELTQDLADIEYITRYFNFIKFCLQSNGSFLNYVNIKKQFTEQNQQVNLQDSNGRTMWALGYMLYMSNFIPISLTTEAYALLQQVKWNLHNIHSTRAMAFAIKGLYYLNLYLHSEDNIDLITNLSNRLVQMYRHEATNEWHWFESYLTYGNSIIPEALLCAWLATDEIIYKAIAHTSFLFLLSKIFNDNSIKVISNKGWLQKEHAYKEYVIGGEQPIDIAYTIIALEKFDEVFPNECYKEKIVQSFNWFLGNNHLHQIIYNPCTGGCYDGLEEHNVNLNQGVESTLSYLMARQIVEKQPKKIPLLYTDNLSLCTH